jgi:hypothetical protein
MVAVNISSFGGMVPALDDRKIPDNAATLSQNIFLYNGNLRGMRTPRYIRDVPAGTTYVYRLPDNYDNASHSNDDNVWLDFVNTQTDVIRAPVFGDVYDRYYWASTTGAPMYNTRARIAASLPAWILGVPAPFVLPTLIVTGGSGLTVTRAYVYTYVSAYGEEGPPSEPVLDTGFIDGSWDVTWADPIASDQGVDRNITHVRLYRTITSSAGVATYFFVDEFALGIEAYSDVLDDTEVSSHSQLETFLWTQPPADLEGFCAMPNGIIASWRNNELWFSEPYRPHAWPVPYVLTVPFPIVGLGIVGQTLVVCTTGYPMTANGVNPLYMTTSTLTTFEPCTSRESIMSAPEGVYYASPNGLVLVNPGQAANVTRDLVTADRWAELTPGRFKAARFGAAYYAYGAITGGVFDEDAFEVDETFIDIDVSGSQQGVLIDTRDVRVAFNLLASDESIVGVMNDAWSNDLFLIWDDKLYWIDNKDRTPDFDVYKWRSKIFHSPKKQNFGAMKVYFTVPDTTPAQAPVRNNTLVQDLAEDQYGLLRVYADDRHILTYELRESGELIRPPSGFKAEWWQLEIEARVQVSQIQMAASVKELQGA